MMRDDALRRWPVESYAGLAQALLRQGVEVVLLGGPGDAWVRSAFDGMAVVDRIGVLTLDETLALMDEGDVLVTHDTGPMHLAGLTRAGLISIFGPTDPRGRIPRRAGSLAIWGGEGFACRPCYDGRDYAPCHHNGCIREVTPDLVAGRVFEMLEERARGEAKPPRVIGGLEGVSRE